MENKKIYARQVPPEYQESPLQQCEEYPENVFVFGNRHLIGHRADEIDAIREALENIAADFEESEKHPHGDFDAWELVENYFPAKIDGTPWTVGDVFLIMGGALNLANYPHEGKNIIADMLAIIYGEPFEGAFLHGCCQSDWQYCIYPAAYGDNFRDTFEAEYFNTGTEWIIHDSDDAPEEPDDIDGFSVYCIDDPREEIAAEMGVNPADVVLYEFNGYIRRAAWKVV